MERRRLQHAGAACGGTRATRLRGALWARLGTRQLLPCGAATWGSPLCGEGADLRAGLAWLSIAGNDFRQSIAGRAGSRRGAGTIERTALRGNVRGTCGSAGFLARVTNAALRHGRTAKWLREDCRLTQVNLAEVRRRRDLGTGPSGRGSVSC